MFNLFIEGKVFGLMHLKLLHLSFVSCIFCVFLIIRKSTFSKVQRGSCVVTEITHPRVSKIFCSQDMAQLLLSLKVYGMQSKNITSDCLQK